MLGEIKESCQIVNTQGSSDHPEHYSTMLQDEASCSWVERDVPLHARGVQLSWLIEFVECIYRCANQQLLDTYRDEIKVYERALAQQKASMLGPWDNIPWVEAVHPKEPQLLELTTQTLVDDYIKPLTESLAAPLYARVPASERGKPTVFLSHAWSSLVLSLSGTGRRGTLDAFSLSGIAGVKEEFAWIDFVCYNQHELADENIVFDMESLVKTIGKVAFAVTPVPLFNRIWCLWELLSVILNEAESQFCAAPGYRSEKRVMVNDFLNAFTSVTAARATKRKDYDDLLNAILAHFGSTEAADTYITNLMKSGMGNPWFELYREQR